MKQKKIALLDTDFTVKTIMSQKDSENHLIDLLMQLSDYSFVCHTKTIEEIKDHDYCSSYEWIQENVKAGKVKVYSDEKILSILQELYGAGATSQYIKFLGNSCDAFSSNRFKDNYAALEELEPVTNESEFLKKLYSCDEAYGKGKGLGEVKLLVLLQTLNTIYPGMVEVFCSDDSGARTGVFLTGKVHCISVISLFYHLKNWGLKKEDAEPYYLSYEKSLYPTQKTFKVYNSTRTNRLDIPCREVFDNIYLDKYDAFGTGVLIEKA